MVILGDIIMDKNKDLYYKEYWNGKGTIERNNIIYATI
jgi:hypothetical protein